MMALTNLSSSQSPQTRSSSAQVSPHPQQQVAEEEELVIVVNNSSSSMAAAVVEVDHPPMAVAMNDKLTNHAGTGTTTVVDVVDGRDETTDDDDDHDNNKNRIGVIQQQQQQQQQLSLATVLITTYLVEIGIQIYLILSLCPGFVPLATTTTNINNSSASFPTSAQLHPSPSSLSSPVDSSPNSWSWFLLIATATTISSILVTTVSMFWVCTGLDFAGKLCGRLLCYGMHFFHLGLLWRFLKLAFAYDRTDIQEFLSLRKFQLFIQSFVLTTLHASYWLLSAAYHKQEHQHNSYHHNNVNDVGNGEENPDNWSSGSSSNSLTLQQHCFPLLVVVELALLLIAIIIYNTWIVAVNHGIGIGLGLDHGRQTAEKPESRKIQLPKITLIFLCKTVGQVALILARIALLALALVHLQLWIFLTFLASHFALMLSWTQIWMLAQAQARAWDGWQCKNCTASAATAGEKFQEKDTHAHRFTKWAKFSYILFWDVLAPTSTKSASFFPAILALLENYTIFVLFHAHLPQSGQIVVGSCLTVGTLIVAMIFLRDQCKLSASALCTVARRREPPFNMTSVAVVSNAAAAAPIVRLKKQLQTREQTIEISAAATLNPPGTDGNGNCGSSLHHGPQEISEPALVKSRSRKHQLALDARSWESLTLDKKRRKRAANGGPSASASPKKYSATIERNSKPVKVKTSFSASDPQLLNNCQTLSTGGGWLPAAATSSNESTSSNSRNTNTMLTEFGEKEPGDEEEEEVEEAEVEEEEEDDEKNFIFYFPEHHSPISTITTTTTTTAAAAAADRRLPPPAARLLNDQCTYQKRPPPRCRSSSIGQAPKAKAARGVSPNAATAFTATASLQRILRTSTPIEIKKASRIRTSSRSPPYGYGKGSGTAGNNRRKSGEAIGTSAGVIVHNEGNVARQTGPSPTTTTDQHQQQQHDYNLMEDSFRILICESAASPGPGACPRRSSSRNPPPSLDDTYFLPSSTTTTTTTAAAANQINNKLRVLCAKCLQNHDPLLTSCGSVQERERHDRVVPAPATMHYNPELLPFRHHQHQHHHLLPFPSSSNNYYRTHHALANSETTEYPSGTEIWTTHEDDDDDDDEDGDGGGGGGGAGEEEEYEESDEINSSSHVSSAATYTTWPKSSYHPSQVHKQCRQQKAQLLSSIMWKTTCSTASPTTNKFPKEFTSREYVRTWLMASSGIGGGKPNTGGNNYYNNNGGYGSSGGGVASGKLCRKNGRNCCDDCEYNVYAANKPNCGGRFGKIDSARARAVAPVKSVTSNVQVQDNGPQEQEPEPQETYYEVLKTTYHPSRHGHVHHLQLPQQQQPVPVPVPTLAQQKQQQRPVLRKKHHLSGAGGNGKDPPAANWTATTTTTAAAAGKSLVTVQIGPEVNVHQQNTSSKFQPPPPPAAPAPTPVLETMNLNCAKDLEIIV